MLCLNSAAPFQSAMLPHPQPRRTRILCPMEEAYSIYSSLFGGLVCNRSVRILAWCPDVTMMCRFFRLLPLLRTLIRRADFFGVWSRTFYYQCLRGLMAGKGRQARDRAFFLTLLDLN